MRPPEPSFLSLPQTGFKESLRHSAKKVSCGIADRARNRENLNFRKFEKKSRSAIKNPENKILFSIFLKKNDEVVFFVETAKETNFFFSILIKPFHF